MRAQVPSDDIREHGVSINNNKWAILPSGPTTPVGNRGLTGVLKVLMGVAVLGSGVVRVIVAGAGAIVRVLSGGGVAVARVEPVLEVADLGHC